MQEDEARHSPTGKRNVTINDKPIRVEQHKQRAQPAQQGQGVAGSNGTAAAAAAAAAAVVAAGAAGPRSSLPQLPNVRPRAQGGRAGIQSMVTWVAACIEAGVLDVAKARKLRDSTDEHGRREQEQWAVTPDFIALFAAHVRRLTTADVQTGDVVQRIIIPLTCEKCSKGCASEARGLQGGENV